MVDDDALAIGSVCKVLLVVTIVSVLVVVLLHVSDGSSSGAHSVNWLSLFVWRVVSILQIVYSILLLFILFQTADDARYFLTYYDPELGVPLPERTYAEECSIYTPGHPDGNFANFFDKMDIFVTSHFLGWFVKALILRNVWFVTILSVLFELLEYTLECQLPNFGECWWDHWILDFAVCNGLGIYLGMITCRYFNLERYHWGELFKVSSSAKGKKESSWIPFHIANFLNFASVAILTIFWLMQELMGFYLKTVLWIAPNHSLNILRQCLYAFTGAYAISEIYHFLQQPNGANVSHIGRFLWLVFAALIIEALIVVKFGWEIITIPIPRAAVVGWSIVFACVAIWAFWKFSYPLREWPIFGALFTRSKKD